MSRKRSTCEVGSDMEGSTKSRKLNGSPDWHPPLSLSRLHVTINDSDDGFDDNAPGQPAGNQSPLHQTESNQTNGTDAMSLDGDHTEDDSTNGTDAISIDGDPTSDEQQTITNHRYFQVVVYGGSERWSVLYDRQQRQAAINMGLNANRSRRVDRVARTERTFAYLLSNRRGMATSDLTFTELTFKQRIAIMLQLNRPNGGQRVSGNPQQSIGQATGITRWPDLRASTDSGAEYLGTQHSMSILLRSPVATDITYMRLRPWIKRDLYDLLGVFRPWICYGTGAPVTHADFLYLVRTAPRDYEDVVENATELIFSLWGQEESGVMFADEGSNDSENGGGILDGDNWGWDPSGSEASSD
ncbi:Uu.00g099560.m01.CDS01 [Anthostomella pinea]|uniref:Uu.00g099560.m01.CDS01 n=1 Tax=Anthostomella pinea TaxID=933095 RepID=A0AAI8YF90_9PEZI|nr:Uu.00g099560.m01.CDS01 [Anthostomella pinea]